MQSETTVHEDEAWKAEVKKPPRDNRYQTEDVTLTKGRSQVFVAHACAETSTSAREALRACMHPPGIFAG